MSQVRVTIEVLPLRHKAVLRFVEAQGHQGVRVLKKSQLVLECEPKPAVYLLTELRHKFPLAYVSGGMEPT